MPDEYIRRKDAAKLLGNIFGVDVVRRLHEVPAVDVAPVVHARWMQVVGKEARICSFCERDEPYKFAPDDAMIYNFCPYCGAKMDGGTGNGQKTET